MHLAIYLKLLQIVYLTALTPKAPANLMHGLHLMEFQILIELHVWPAFVHYLLLRTHL
jgi:hypothetical protein